MKQIRFRVFQDPAGEWQAWNEENFQIAETNHTRNHTSFSHRFLDAMRKAVIVYANDAQGAIEKGKTITTRLTVT